MPRDFEIPLPDMNDPTTLAHFAVRVAIALSNEDGPRGLDGIISSKERSRRLRLDQPLTREAVVDVEVALDRIAPLGPAKSRRISTFFDAYPTGRGPEWKPTVLASGDVAGHWLPGLIDAGPSRNRDGVLMRAHALRNWLKTHNSLGGQVTDAAVNEIISDLLTIAELPHGDGGAQAVNIAAGLGTRVLEPIKRRLATDPISFRLLRIVSAALRAAVSDSGSFDDNECRKVIRIATDILRATHDASIASLYRGRCLDLEVASVIPNTEDSAWLTDHLFEKATVGMPHARTATKFEVMPRRVRSYAAFLLVQRRRRALGLQQLQPLDKKDLGVVADVLRHFEEETDPGDGLVYTAAFLRQTMMRGHSKFYPTKSAERRASFWETNPEVKWVEQHVGAASSGISEFDGHAKELREGVETLVCQSLLACDGVLRRKALELCQVADTGPYTSRIFEAVADAALNDGKHWLCELSVFGLSYVGGDESVPALLRFANERAVDTETRLAALMGVADVAHSLHADDEKAELAGQVATTLDELYWSGELTLPEARAVVYAAASLRLDDMAIQSILSDAETAGTSICDGKANDWMCVGLARWGRDRMNLVVARRDHPAQARGLRRIVSAQASTAAAAQELDGPTRRRVRFPSTRAATRNDVPVFTNGPAPAGG